MKRVRDIAKELGVKPSFLYSLYYRGKVKGKHVEVTQHALMLDEQSVYEYLANRKVRFVFGNVTPLRRKPQDSQTFFHVVFSTHSQLQDVTLLNALKSLFDGNRRIVTVPLYPQGIDEKNVYEYIGIVASAVLEKINSTGMQADVEVQKGTRLNEAKIKNALKQSGINNIRIGSK